ncbi:winged helix-turn-helix domain-containing protein [Pseudomonas sp. NPDC090202]|uniref:winged helix-turn-helix domain-containing protein n=1 Tax=unclassified Pseudomonas TaxID=196821 RepID=UPI003801DC70
MMIQLDERSSSRSYAFGQWQLRQNTLFDGQDRGVPLPPKEYAVLSLLLEAKGDVVTKDELLDGVWLDGEVAEESLTRCIYSLRKVLGTDKTLIASVYGKGYRFTAPVVSLASSGQTAVPSLAILPFRGDNPALSIELHEHTVRRLTRAFVHGLRLLPASMTAGQFDEGDLLGVFERLAPDYVMAGRCTVFNGMLQLSVELVRRVDHLLIHSEVLKADSHDDAIQRLAVLVAQRLPGVRAQPQSCSSYPLAVAYLNGLTDLQIFTPNSLAAALKHFRQCLRLSTDYAPTWNALADTWLGMAISGSATQSEAIAEAQAAIGKALALDPDDEVALVRLALLTSFQGNADAAEALFRRARICAEPTDLWYHYAWYQWACGDHDAALACVDTCLGRNSSLLPALILRLRILVSRERDAALMAVLDSRNGLLCGHPVLEALLRELRATDAKPESDRILAIDSNVRSGSPELVSLSSPSLNGSPDNAQVERENVACRTYRFSIGY